MGGLRHILGLVAAMTLIVAAVWVWQSYPGWVRMEPFRPWRADLMTWRIPILALVGFGVLSLLSAFSGKFLKSSNE